MREKKNTFKYTLITSFRWKQLQCLIKKRGTFSLLRFGKRRVTEGVEKRSEMKLLRVKTFNESTQSYVCPFWSTNVPSFVQCYSCADRSTLWISSSSCSWSLTECAAWCELERFDIFCKCFDFSLSPCHHHQWHPYSNLSLSEASHQEKGQ